MTGTGALELALAGAGLWALRVVDGAGRSGGSGHWVSGGWKRGPGTTAGRWATRADMAPLAVRRPGLGRVVLGRAHGRLVAAEAGHSVLVVGPTQSLKTSGFAVPALLEWEGPVLAATVKSDLVRHTLSWRRSRGPAWLYDPARSTGLGRSPWSPLEACGTWAGARRVARDLADAARPSSGSLADGEFWYSTAAKLLGPLLLAAACSGRTMADVVRWLDEQEQLEVADALYAVGAEQALQAARASWGRDERQRSAVYTTAETVLEPFADPSLAEGSGAVIDPEALLRENGTLFLCAPAHDQRRLRPLFAALAGEVLDTAVGLSARQGAPLDPPLLVVLDEAANVAPLAELDVLASTAAGHGIQLVTVWQDLAQLTARYGPRAGTVVNNHRVKVFLPGIADPGTLDHASALAGDTEERQRTTNVDARGGRSTTEAQVTRRLVPPDVLRRLPPGTAVAVSGHLPPVRLALRPWWRHAELRCRAEHRPVVPEAAEDTGGAVVGQRVAPSPTDWSVPKGHR